MDEVLEQEAGLLKRGKYKDIQEISNYRPPCSRRGVSGGYARSALVLCASCIAF